MKERMKQQIMAGLKDKISRKQEEAIVALLSQGSAEDAARSCGTPVRTLYRWLKDPELTSPTEPLAHANGCDSYLAAN